MQRKAGRPEAERGVQEYQTCSRGSGARFELRKVSYYLTLRSPSLPPLPHPNLDLDHDLNLSLHTFRSERF